MIKIYIRTRVEAYKHDIAFAIHELNSRCCRYLDHHNKNWSGGIFVAPQPIVASERIRYAQSFSG